MSEMFFHTDVVKQDAHCFITALTAASEVLAVVKWATQVWCGMEEL